MSGCKGDFNKKKKMSPKIQTRTELGGPCRSQDGFTLRADAVKVRGAALRAHAFARSGGWEAL